MHVLDVTQPSYAILDSLRGVPTYIHAEANESDEQHRLRRGELIGLQWGDIDLKERYLLVRRAVVRRNVGLPKSNKIRRVDLSGQLCIELKTLREIRELEAMSNGQTLKLDEPVFLSPMGFQWEAFPVWCVRGGTQEPLY